MIDKYHERIGNGRKMKGSSGKIAVINGGEMLINNLECCCTEFVAMLSE